MHSVKKRSGNNASSGLVEKNFHALECGARAPLWFSAPAVRDIESAANAGALQNLEHVEEAHQRLAPSLRRSHYYVCHLSTLIRGLVPGRATHSVGYPIDHRLRHRASRGARLLLRLRRGHGGADDDSRCEAHRGSRRSVIIAAITVAATAAIMVAPAAIVVI